jgi:hypothetical protein
MPLAVPIFYPLIYGLAMFAVTTLVSIPVGIVTGFREARKQPLSSGAATALSTVESAAELAALVAISVKLIHASDGQPFWSIVLAYGLLIVLEAIGRRVLKSSAPAKWLRSFATLFAAGAISILVA